MTRLPKGYVGYLPMLLVLVWQLITDKERDVQYALGLVSWYRIEAETQVGWRLSNNFEAVSEEDALQQFEERIRCECVCSVREKALQDLNEGRYHIKILPWTVGYYRIKHYR